MKAKLLFAFLLLISFTGFGQSVQIRGTVTDVDEVPFPGVSFLIQGTTSGGTSDFDGNFVLDVEIGQTIIFSYLGYLTNEIVVENDQFLNVIMQEDTQSLEEVVIIGYGSQKVSKVSGAVTSVSEKTIESMTPVRTEDALQGNAAGVTVIQSGSPGATPTVLVRGIPSYSGTSPLVVIDGTMQTLDDLNALNPSDIKSLTVLKDASMTAIYGVKGGNGVIVVTTKSGSRNSKTKYSFDAYYGVQEVDKTIDVLNATEYAAILNEASVNSGGDLVFPDISQFGEGTDWQNEVLTAAPIQNYNFTASGGSETSNFFVSAGYLSQEGVVFGGDKSYFDRINLTMNYTTDLNDDLKLIVNTSYANIQNSGLPENSITSVLSNALNFDPTLPVYDENGNYSTSSTITQEIVNPLAQISNNYNENETNKLWGKLELQQDFTDNFGVTARYGYTYVDISQKSFNPLAYYGAGHNATTMNADGTPIFGTDENGEQIQLNNNSVSESKTNYFSFNFESFANWDFKVGENNNFQTIVGFALAKNSGSSVGGSAQDVPFNSWDYADISSATGDVKSQSVYSWQYVTRNISYFARVNYDFNDRLLLSFAGRIDGSTNFGANNKYAFFPSGSVGYILTGDESNSFLKIRGSAGTVGNDNINPQFATITTFPKYTFDGQIITGSALQGIPNDDVSWEKQLQVNVGFDARLFGDRVSIIADYYQKNVDDLLFNPTLSLYLGTPVYPAANIGSTKSNGLDLTVGYNDTFGEEFHFNTNFNVTTSKNMVTAINNGDKFIWGGGYGIPYKTLVRFEEGYAPGYFYGYKTDGVFQSQDEIDAHATQDGAQPGDIRYVDVNGDGIVDDNDRTDIGNPFPRFTVGWNFSMNFKGFDLAANTYASIGSSIYRAYERNLNYTNRAGQTLNRWTGPGTSNSEPRVTFIDTNNNLRPSDRYVEDGDYIRITNLQLGYSFGADSVENIGFSQIRFYAQAKNALTLTNYTGYTPEISGGVMDSGVDRGAYPQPRIWSLGVNLKF
ncbi:MAG: SusC/RagA family TonB-linked outer membrane protein [Flavobacteriaceae bacterium]